MRLGGAIVLLVVRRCNRLQKSSGDYFEGQVEICNESAKLCTGQLGEAAAGVCGNVAECHASGGCSGSRAESAVVFD